MRRMMSAVLAGALLLAAVPAAAMKIQRVVSPGGIEAWLVEEHSVPLIAMNFAFPGGSAQDPEGREGVANVITTLMDEGAGDIPSEAFQAREEELSMRMRFEDGRDWLYGEVKALSARRDDTFALVALALAKPRFDADAVERMKAAAIAGVRREEKDPDAIAGRIWAEALFPGHPYGRPSEGTIASIQSLQAEDFRAYHGRVFTRAGLKIGVTGDIDAATLAPLLDKVFGALPATGALTPVPEAQPRTGFTLTRTLDIPQTIVRLSVPGLKRDDPEFIPAFVMNHILGGGTFSSWLYDEVREKRGLAYSVSTSLATYRHSALFAAASGTRNDAAGETVGLIRQQMRRMAEEGPTEAELAKAKAYLIGSYALRFDTSDKIAEYVLGLQTENLGLDYPQKRNALLEAVTLADVRKVARRLLSAEPALVTVGGGR